jgi:hypothetical protein
LAATQCPLRRQGGYTLLDLTAFGRFLFPVWATSQMAPRDCDSQRQSNLSGVHLAMDANQQYDTATIAILRRAFDDVFSDPRYFDRRSTSALEIAEHLLAQAAIGERDLDRLKASAFNKLTNP